MRPAVYRYAETAEPLGIGFAFIAEGIELRGVDVVIIEGAPDRPGLARLSDRLWQSKKSRR